MSKQNNFEIIKEKIQVINFKIDFLYKKEGIKKFLTSFDPLNRPTKHLLPCNNCGKVPMLKYNGKIYIAVCNCREFSLSRRKSISVPQYNKSPLSITIPYWKIPAFNIPTPEEMEPLILYEKIKMLRTYFELKTKLAILRRKLKYTTTNLRHIHCLKAFTVWAMYLQGEVKRTIKSRSPRNSETFQSGTI